MYSSKRIMHLIDVAVRLEMQIELISWRKGQGYKARA
jgi:hypothetical protein